MNSTLAVVYLRSICLRTKRTTTSALVCGQAVSSGLSRLGIHGNAHTIVGVCVDDGWFKQPHMAESDWTLGLGEVSPHTLKGFFQKATTSGHVSLSNCDTSH